MAIELLPFDASVYLASDESQAELLADAMESGDAHYIAHALRTMARAQNLARDPFSGPEEALGSDSDLKLSTVLEMVRVLGLKLVPVKAENAPSR